MEKKLQRDENSKMIGGVAAGLAEYFDIDVTWVRVGFILAILAGLSGILAYIVLWIAVPAKPFALPNSFTTDYRVYEEKGSAMPVTDFKSTYNTPVQPEKKGNGQLIAGILLIGMGLIFLTDQFDFLPYWFSFHKLWPLALIIPGIIILSKAKNRTPVYNSADEPVVQNESVSQNKPVSETDNTTKDQPLN